MSFKDIQEIQAYVPLARLGVSLAVDIIDAFTSDVDPADEVAVMERLEAKGAEFERVMASIANSRTALREAIAKKKAEQAG